MIDKFALPKQDYNPLLGKDGTYDLQTGELLKKKGVSFNYLQSNLIINFILNLENILF